MCASVLVPPPPYMLGERPTPLHGGSGSPSFRQVPFVRVNERVESGIKVRKQLRKYLKASSATQHIVAQMHLSDACIPAMQPQEIAQSCFENFFAHMNMYNRVVGQKHLEASKAFLEMTKPLDQSGKSRKWARDVYNQVQKCVQDVVLAEKKMEKARQRKEHGEEELSHWRKVLEANEATYQVQPNNPEVIRAYQQAQYRFSNAFAEEEAAKVEYEEAKSGLYASIERRDQVVEEATELSQSMEEDRLDTMLIVINQFVETKVAILQAEIEAMSSMQKILREMDRESVIQQYIVDSIKPELTHRHAKALYIMEWHRLWHQEQAAQSANEPMTYIALSPEDVVKVKNAGISSNDVEVIKDFVASCFIDPEPALVGSGKSAKHRNRFTDTSTSLSMYRMEVVRKVMLNCLNHQRGHSQELSKEGFTRLAGALRILLDAASEKEDTKTLKNVMNMIQTFYHLQATPSTAASESGKKVYLHASLKDHVIWSSPEYWGNALLVSVGEELSKNLQETPWYFLSGQERLQMVMHIHNMVFGQVTSFIYHLTTYGFSKKQIFQYVQNVCFAYELGEEQRISLIASVQSLDLDDGAGPRRVTIGEEEEEVHFTSLTLPDWTTIYTSASSGQKFRPFFRGRTPSTGSDTRVSDGASITSSYISNPSGVRDLEEMKSLADAVSVSNEESWEDLFGFGPGAVGTATTSSNVIANNNDEGLEENKETPKRMKKKKNSRKFNDQLRLARALPLSHRIAGEEVDATALAPVTSSQNSNQKIPKQPSPKKNISNDSVVEVSGEKAHLSSRQSFDDATMANSHPLEKKRSKRLLKARSAASIDTSMLYDPEIDQRPAVSRGTSEAAIPEVYGLDKVKVIAAQMKQRRQVASATGLNGNGDGLLPPRPSSSTASGSGASNDATPSTSSQPGSDSPAEQVEKLSGVAALRARFEKR